MFRLSKRKRISVIILSVIALISIGLVTFYLINGSSFDMRSSAGNSTWKIGDLNADQKVTMADFNIWLTGYRKNKKDGTYDTIPDLDKDKKIAFKDFFLWLDAYREYKHTVTEEFETISKTNDMGTFKLEYKFMGDNTWFYKMTGTFSKASICDVGSVNIGIAENANAVDAVAIYLNGTPFKEELPGCTGLFTKEGEFTAASNANITFALRELGQVSTNIYNTKPVDYSSMTLTYSYTGSNTWSYTIKGDLPDKCFTVSQTISVVNPSLTRTIVGGVENLSSSSSANTAIYVYNLMSPDKITDQICTGTTLKYSKTGTFKGAENAKIKFISTPAYPAVGLITEITPVLTTQATYLGDNLWSYKVKGEFPNDCYSAKTVVSPSYAEYDTSANNDPRCTIVGELVKCNSVNMVALATAINLQTVITMTSNTSHSCASTVQEYTATGKFVATEKATFGSHISAILK